MIVGGYTMDLYCEICNRDESFYGAKASSCRKQARAAGWLLRNGLRGFTECWCITCKAEHGPS